MDVYSVLDGIRVMVYSSGIFLYLHLTSVYRVLESEPYILGFWKKIVDGVFCGLVLHT